MSASKASSSAQNRSSALAKPRSSCHSGHNYRSDKTVDQRTAISGISSNGFKIGDRVSVSGARPGTICFIGKTKFADGEWAGINLDEPGGKNDGSVSGVRYFQCPPKHGLFSRLSTLTFEPPKHNSTKQQLSRITAKTSASTSVNACIADLRSNSEQPTKSSGINAPDSVKAEQQATECPLKVGMRVTVGGTRQGTLRFVGSTQFSKGRGLFAGVELDEPSGKNDGSVDGERYFFCKPHFGLFAPVHRVHPLHPDPTDAGLGSTALPLVQSAQYGSQESISSSSSARAPRMRLGVTSLTCNSVTRSTTSSSPTETLKKVVQEKQEHIEQLLREREHERSEIARAQAQVEEAEEARIASERLLIDAQDQIEKLTSSLVIIEREKDELGEKVEDLQFRMAEELVNENSNSDDKSQVTALLEQISKLENKVQEREFLYDQLKIEYNELHLSQQKSIEPNESSSDQNTRFADAEVQTFFKNFEKSTDEKFYPSTTSDKREASLEIYEKKLNFNACEQESKEQELSCREKELCERERKATAKENCINSAKSKMDDKVSELAALQSYLNEREQAVQIRESELSKRESLLSARENDMRERECALLKSEERFATTKSELQIMQTGINSDKLVITKKQDELSKKESIIHQQEFDIEKIRVNLQDEEARIKNRLEEIRKKEAVLAVEQKCLNEQTASLQSKQSEVTELKLLLESRESEVSAKECQLKEAFEKIAEREKKAKVHERDRTYKVPDTETSTPFSPNDSCNDLKQQQQQIEFLNSVIVDLKNKNQKLQSDIYLLTELDQPGSLIASSQTGCSNQNRPYCDICEEFDLHETEDCPIQAGGDSLSNSMKYLPDNRKLAGEKDKSSRPYCEICEKFGHVAADCDDETY